MIPRPSSRTCSSADSRRLRSSLVLLATAFVGTAPLVSLAADPPPAPAPAAETLLLLDGDYRLEATAAFAPALLHWLDTLARLEGPGLTAGKTRPAHVAEYERLLGAASAADLAMLRRYAVLRMEDGAADGTGEALASAFFESESLEGALARARLRLSDAAARELTVVVEHFAPRYRSIWKDGGAAREFFERARADPRRHELARFLVAVAAFYGVEPERERPPRLVLTPVDHGSGTHAQALGRCLLVEVRRGEALADEIAPIVHENAHFLFLRMGAERMRALEAVARQAGPHGITALQLLHEALPTAIAQGVAWQRLGSRDWSRDAVWYHLRDVDEYAKRLHPLVARTLDAGGRFDEGFLRAAIEAYAPAPTPGSPAASR